MSAADLRVHLARMEQERQRIVVRLEARQKVGASSPKDQAAAALERRLTQMIAKGKQLLAQHRPM